MNWGCQMGYCWVIHWVIHWVQMKGCHWVTHWELHWELHWGCQREHCLDCWREIH